MAKFSNTIFVSALEMKSRQIEVNKVSEELKKRTQEIRELQLRLQEAEKILVRNFLLYVTCTLHLQYYFRSKLYFTVTRRWSRLREQRMVREWLRT